MSKTTRLFKSFYRLLFPVVVLIMSADSGIGLVSPQFGKSAENRISRYARKIRSTQHESRPSYRRELAKHGRDKITRLASSRNKRCSGGNFTPSLRGNRFYILNLGVKMNELTNFTVLMPDLRGHGENPSVQNSSFGGCENQDTVAAIAFLRSLKNADNETLVGKNIGIYGVELGTLVGLFVAANDESVKALVLDSIPSNSNDLLASVVDRRYPFASFLTSKMAKGGSYVYFAGGCFERQSACELTKSLTNRKVMLLAGADAPHFQISTSNLSSCFPPQTKVTANTNLNPSGFGITQA